MYLLAPFILQNLKKNFRVDPELWGCAIFGHEMAHSSWTKFFWYKPLSLLSATYWPFPLHKILKNSYSGSRVMRMHHFWTQNGSFAPNNFFLNIILIYLLAPYIVQILKNFFQRIQSYEDAQFLGPKWPICPNEDFFQKTC